MSWKKFLLVGIFAMAFMAVPAHAGTVGVYGAFWDTDDADSSWGAGARVGFDFLSWLELEFHGTYFPEFGGDVLGSDIDISVIPVDGGLKFKLFPNKPATLYVGAGATYYFLDSDDVEIDNETGYYAEAGVEFGGEHTRLFFEVMWRAMDATIDSGILSGDASFDGLTGQFGVNWTWGK
ncbi:MAG TPA: outer membrane beta-barrel protein [Candidatus Polarisedimenticolia bacterium]|nr:outer membrane beta-barrel protein [Candidatus Polarisedimenticolia bacterium]